VGFHRNGRTIDGIVYVAEVITMSEMDDLEARLNWLEEEILELDLDSDVIDEYRRKAAMEKWLED
jgi:hypothetical protein